jgi:diguanylate cyclase (GGDEF)-like protein
MRKDEIITLVNQMHKELLSTIDHEKKATKEQISNYLSEAADIFKTIDEDDKNIGTDAYAEALFHNAYKDIAQESLESYANTNQSIEKLVTMHEETFSECQNEQIDLPSITEKFTEIQNHMTQEVTKANKIITELTTKVKALEEKSNLDPLTKIFNRGALISYLNNICSRQDLPYSFHLLILDIDDFKKINDTYGHIAGDKVLIFIANILRKTLRDGDKVFRYGGEEFVIILNRINDKQCKQITQRLINMIQSNNLIYKGAKLDVTMSVGTTRYKQQDTPETLVARADSALYKAKSNGKNQMYSEL